MSERDAEASARWGREACFFDREASRVENVRPMDPRAIRRFASSRLRARFQKELRIGLIGDPAGKRVLDVGCGEGVNAVLLAMLGAHVTGTDVSSRSIRAAERRAELSGVSERVELHCSPIETLEVEARSFDVVWCDSILHHLIPVLGTTMRRLAELSKEDATFIAYEPVNLHDGLRRLRLATPVRTVATPDERPLTSAELEIIRTHLDGARLHYFALFGRLDRFILGGRILERARPPRRAIVEGLAAIDAAAFRVPWVRRLAGRVVIEGRLAQPQT